MACYLVTPLCLWMALSHFEQTDYYPAALFLTAAVIQRFRLDEANDLSSDWRIPTFLPFSTLVKLCTGRPFAQMKQMFKIVHR